MNPLRMVIFAKAPRAGQVKTRLIPALGAEGAAALAEQLLLHTVDQALEAATGAVEVCCSPFEDAYWQRAAWRARVTLSDQGDGSLGERMARASRRACDAGESVLLLGTDCPALTAPRLRLIATGLHQHDSVIVPALDGGYVALGFHRFDARLFEGIAWSTDTVAADTLARIRQLGWTLQQFPAERDLDEPDDLQACARLLSQLQQRASTGPSR